MPVGTSVTEADQDVVEALVQWFEVIAGLCMSSIQSRTGVTLLNPLNENAQHAPPFNADSAIMFVLPRLVRGFGEHVPSLSDNIEFSALISTADTLAYATLIQTASAPVPILTERDSHMATLAAEVNDLPSFQEEIDEDDLMI